MTAFLQESYGGATRSPDSPATFKGYWFDEANRKLWVDDIAIAFTDIDLNTFRDRIDGELSALETKAREIYDSGGVHEEEFWVTCETIDVFQP